MPIKKFFIREGIEGSLGERLATKLGVNDRFGTVNKDLKTNLTIVGMPRLHFDGEKDWADRRFKSSNYKV